ncbi:hypothetical protein BKA67DRAFT_531307 [Truncatella angustata]|uniref:Uncharacterized protein n=1 Tax=Truncatella angustata TaxID=152316 RepID=A0A9P9A478_9PEZI|nr:uncharacterized protein BKA67DRAFT_531307 [Truncatella angustata]KAH6661247.1 hypothetical protein BKA67DRAFT_531307 [Truncatella angustata]
MARVGTERLDRGEFVIEDSITSRVIDMKNPWASCFRPGRRVEMAMVLFKAVFDEKCPSCDFEPADQLRTEISRTETKLPVLEKSPDQGKPDDFSMFRRLCTYAVISKISRRKSKDAHQLAFLVLNPRKEAIISNNLSWRDRAHRLDAEIFNADKWISSQLKTLEALNKETTVLKAAQLFLRTATETLRAETNIFLEEHELNLKKAGLGLDEQSINKECINLQLALGI